MKFANRINGILVVNKPKGLTSRDVVNRIQNYLQTKAGHTGTLDPMAQGVLVLTLGKATKLTEILTSEIKEYEAEVTLGVETDTLDIEGMVLKQQPVNIHEKQIKKVLEDFKKTYLQEVPKYSAVKVNGRKLYEYARQGQSVILPKKEVTVYDLKLLDYKGNKFRFYAKVSKGTYIRSLIRDICENLKTVGTMSALIRLKQGKFMLSEAYSLEEIIKGHYEVISIKDALEIPWEIVSDDLKEKILNGQKLEGPWEKVLFIDKEEKELAIYHQDKQQLRMWKMLYENNRKVK